MTIMAYSNHLGRQAYQLLCYTDDVSRTAQTTAQLHEVSSVQSQYDFVTAPAKLDGAAISRSYDILICDVSPATLSTTGIIELTRTVQPAIPVMVIVDTASVDEVVDLMRMGVRAVVQRKDRQRLADLIRQELTAHVAAYELPADRHSLVASNLTPETQRQLLENILETAQEAVLSLSQPDGRLIFASASFEQVLGYPVESFLNNPQFLLSILHPDDLGSVLEAMQTAMRDGFAEFVHRIILPDGNVRWLHRRATVLTDEHHQMIQVTDSAKDITAQREAEAALRASEELHRMVLSSISDAVFITDSAGVFTYVCPNIHMIFGYSREEIIAHNNIASVLGDSLIEPDVLERVGEVSNIERQITDRFGQKHDLLVNVKRVQIGRGTTLFTCRDITERKTMEAALRDSEIRYRSIVEDQSAYICRYDRDLRLTFGNRAYCDLVGLNAQALIGHSILDWIPVEEHDECVAYVRSLTREAPTAVSIHRSVQHDGHLRWTEWLDRAFFDEHGEVAGYQGVGRDITEQKLAEDALRASEEKYRSLVDSSNAAIMMVDPAGRILFLNTIAAAGFSQVSQSLGGAFVQELLPANEAQQLIDDVKSVVVSGTVMEKEVEVTLSETPLWYRVSTRPVRDADGQPYAALVHATNITERRNAESALRQSEERLRLFIRYAPAAIAMFDRNMVYLAVSNRWLSDYHLGDQDIIGRSHYEVFPDIPDVWKEIHRRCLNGAVEQSDADPFPRADGTLDWVRWEIRPWRDHSGEIGGILLFSEVITAQKQIEQALQEANALLEQRVFERTSELERTKNRIEAIFNNSADGVLLLSLEHGIQQANNAFERMFEVSDADYLGAKLSNLFHSDAESIEHSLQTVAATHQVQNITARWLKDDGSSLDVEISVASINRSEQAFSNLVCIIRDVTKRKQAEDLLRESEARYRLLAENVKDVIVKLSPDGTRTFVTPSITGLIGYEPQELIGQSPLEFIHPDDLMLTRQTVQTALLTRQDHFSVTHRARHKNGTDVWVESSLTVVRDPVSAELVELIGVLRDISERKQAQEAIAEERNLLRTLIDALPDHIYVKDTQGRILLNNMAYTRALGYETPQALSGKTDSDLLPAVQAAKAYEAEQWVYASGVPFTSSDEQFVFPSGNVAWLLTTRVPLRNLQGDVIGLVGISHDITQIKAGEEALRLSEERYRTTVTALSEGVVVYDSSGSIQVCNSAAEQILGLSRDQMMRRAPLDPGWHVIRLDGSPFADDENLPMFTVHGGEPQFNVVMGIHKPDGDLTWTLVNVQPLLDRLTGRPNLFVVSIIDITQTKKSADALRESEARYRLIAENINDVIVKLLPDGLMTFVTPSCRTLTGYHPEEVVNHSIWDMLHPDDVFVSMARFRQALESNASLVELTQRIRHKDGRYIWVEMTNTIVRDVGSGQPLEAIAIIHDIDARKAAEDKLMALSQRLQLATETGGIGIWDWDIVSDALIWDDQMYRLYGVRPGDAPHAFQDSWESGYLHEDDHDRIRGDIQDAISGKKPLDTEFRIKRPDGSIHHLKAKAVVFWNADGVPLRMIGVNWEITLLKQAEENLRSALEKEKELSELKSRFVSMASHEFRTPLAAILATTETLGIYRDRMDQSQIDARLNKIRQQVAHMREIMEDVLQLARIQAGRVEFKPSLEDLDALCRDIVEEFDSQNGYRGRIVYQSDAVALKLSFDARLMRQIISNLISNALKYSRAESPVYFDLGRGADQLVLTVRDVGIGIPPNDLRYLFEPFHRASNVGTIAGTGLGLTIARQSVEMHGGSIVVDSLENTGTTITVRLPITPLLEEEHGKDHRH
ncbi:MAG: PAS domain S-box protein [Anaerolineae bacterium]|nr:PAS domain S-box protein [Anaerolineae bacterium]